MFGCTLRAGDGASFPTDLLTQLEPATAAAMKKVRLSSASAEASLRFSGWRTPLRQIDGSNPQS
jgi:hypothetical protein